MAALFSLIKTLTKKEKKAINLYIKNRGKEDSNYALVFRHILNNPNISDKELQDSFKKKNIKNWSLTKKYIYDLIIKVLKSQDNHTDLGMQILGGLQEIRLLATRGLHPSAYEKMLEVKAIAAKHHQPIYTCLLNEWEMNTRVYMLPYSSYSIDELKQWEDNYTRDINKILMHTKNELLRVKIISMHKEKNWLALKELSLSIKETLTLDAIEEIEDFEDRLDKRRLLYLIYGLEDDFINKIDSVQRQIMDFVQHQHKSNQYNAIYIQILQITILDYTYLSQWDNADNLISIYELKTKSEESKHAKILRNYVDLVRWVRKGECSDHVATIKDIKRFFSKKISETPISHDALLFTLGMAYWCLGEVDETLTILESIDKDVIQQEWFIHLKLILEIALFYEKDALLVIPYRVNSLYKMFRKERDEFFIFKQQISSFLRKISTLKPNDSPKELFLAHQNELLELMKKETGGRAFYKDYWCYFVWLDTHISTISFADSAKKNNLKFIETMYSLAPYAIG